MPIEAVFALFKEHGPGIVGLGGVLWMLINWSTSRKKSDDANSTALEVNTKLVVTRTERLDKIEDERAKLLREISDVNQKLAMLERKLNYSLRAQQANTTLIQSLRLTVKQLTDTVNALKVQLNAAIAREKLAVEREKSAVEREQNLIGIKGQLEEEISRLETQLRQWANRLTSLSTQELEKLAGEEINLSESGATA